MTRQFRRDVIEPRTDARTWARPENLRKVAAYAAAHYDAATGVVLDELAASGVAGFDRTMRPLVDALLIKLGAPYTAEELTAKDDALALAYLVLKLTNEMASGGAVDAGPDGKAPAPPDPEATASQAPPTAADRAQAEQLAGGRQDHESKESHARRVDDYARTLAAQRAADRRPGSAAARAAAEAREAPGEREEDRLALHADAEWRSTLRAGTTSPFGGKR